MPERGHAVGQLSATARAIDYLGSHGREVIELPPELHVGIDYAAYIRDPEGHLVELYYSMEQLGWDGQPRPGHLRPSITKPWPDAVDAQTDTYVGSAYMGPLG